MLFPFPVANHNLTCIFACIWFLNETLSKVLDKSFYFFYLQTIGHGENL